VADLFAIWWDKHQDRPVAASKLHNDVIKAIDPQGRGRQHLTARLLTLDGARTAGFVLTRQPPAGKWGAATYALKKTGAAGIPGSGPGNPGTP
jgi:hypothetical protein